MQLSEIAKILQPKERLHFSDCAISDLTEDSRAVTQSALFFARAGKKTSGEKFIQEALQKGAAALVAQAPVASWSGPQLIVDNVEDAEIKIAAAFYGFPSKKLRVVGITGTNGKTTLTYILESIAHQARQTIGIVGTINYRITAVDPKNNAVWPAPNTTPNALVLQKFLAECVLRKVDWVVMEVSSHALALNRVEGVEFDGAIFTNLTQDHLDFHKTMDDYFEAKAKLFTSLAEGHKSANKFAVVNWDDAYGHNLEAKTAVPITSYSIDHPSHFHARNIELESGFTQFVLEFGGGLVQVRTPLIGRHNIYNILAAWSAARKMGYDDLTIQKGITALTKVPGRLESVSAGQNFTVVVDYAHTEDALRNVLGALKAIAKKRILCLFGCGGDRDRGKRPLMGQAASELCDWVVVTSDNPRSENPQQIALDVEVGIRRVGKNNYEVVIDREEAIRKILSLAQKNDVVLLAGKGHETYQIFSDKTVDFDDREIARKILHGRAGDKKS